MCAGSKHKYVYHYAHRGSPMPMHDKDRIIHASMKLILSVTLGYKVLVEARSSL